MAATETSDQSATELVRTLTLQFSDLVRTELRLARAEMAAKARELALGTGLVATAAILALFGAGAMTAAVVLALALVLPAWASALIVGFALLLLAGAIALVGRARLRRAAPPVPTQALNNLQADVDAVKSAAGIG
jgi:uncharacterized membrane protein YqjE